MMPTKKISKQKMAQTKRKVWGVLTVSLCCVFGFYLYFVNVTVAETVGRTRNIQNIHEVGSEYQEIEEMYFSLLNKFDSEYIYSLGFVDQQSADFVTRQTVVAKR